MNDDSETIIASLQLQPHPEGGWYRETWRDQPGDGSRGSGTAIYYLLRAGERSHWHRVDAVEIWHWYAGGALTLSVSEDGKTSSSTQLGPSFALGHRPQLIVPKGVWQSAETRSRWTLVGCTVSPAFDFAGFELAKPGWSPG
ncbi:MAG: hypothetical protein JWM77_3863 [Rhodospirillales bacterium]|nr:hypothetical protein [Rhodospirillales bacterium]